MKMEHPYKAKSGLSSTISQFLAKLWRLVNDEETDDKICWSEVSCLERLASTLALSTGLTPLISARNCEVINFLGGGGGGRDQ